MSSLNDINDEFLNLFEFLIISIIVVIRFLFIAKLDLFLLSVNIFIIYMGSYATYCYSTVRARSTYILLMESYHKIEKTHSAF